MQSKSREPTSIPCCARDSLSVAHRSGRLHASSHSRTCMLGMHCMQLLHLRKSARILPAVPRLRSRACSLNRHSLSAHGTNALTVKRLRRSGRSRRRGRRCGRGGCRCELQAVLVQHAMTILCPLVAMLAVALRVVGAMRTDATAVLLATTMLLPRGILQV